MIRLHDILQLPTFAQARSFVSFDTCAQRRVRSVGVLDYEAITGRWDSFSSSDIVLTTLGFCGQNPELARDALLHLADKRVAAVFAKQVFDWEPDEALCQTFAERGIGLFLYDTTNLEDMIFEAKTLLLSDQRADRARELTEQIFGASDESKRAALFFELMQMKPHPNEPIGVCALAFSVDDTHTLSTRALCERITEEISLEGCSGICVTYESHMLVWIALSKPAPDSIDSSETLNTFNTHRLNLALSMSTFPGISTLSVSECLSPKQAHLAGLEAFWLVQSDPASAALLPTPISPDTTPRILDACTQSIALYPHAIQHADFGAHLATRDAGILRHYDDEHGTDLFPCIQTYVACGGDSALCAQKLHQHPNSVRNRLRKIRELLSLQNTHDKEFFAYISFIVHRTSTQSMW